MTVSSTAIVFTRYILLEWLRRKANDPKTICELFYVCCDDIQDIELCTALSSLVSIFMEGVRTEAIKITNAVKTQLINPFPWQEKFQTDTIKTFDIFLCKYCLHTESLLVL